MANEQPAPIQTPLVFPETLLITLPWIQYLQWLAQNSGGGGASGSYLAEYSLTVATTNIASPTASPAVGDVLTVVMTQDATGGRLITWDAGPPSFNLVTVNDLDERANWVTVANFRCLADGNWWLAAPVFSRLP